MVCEDLVEGKLKGVDTYKEIETNQYGINIENLIHSVCHIQDENKQDVIMPVETVKQVYLLYQSPYKSNSEYPESLKSHSKLIDSHNGALGYH